MTIVRDELTCKEFVELVTDYLEGALSADLRAQLEAHLQICDDCTLYLGQMRLTIAALRASTAGPLSSDVRERLLRSFRQIRPRG
jgi:anti-sigma factor RsiW